MSKLYSYVIATHPIATEKQVLNIPSLKKSVNITFFENVLVVFESIDDKQRNKNDLVL